MLIKLFSLFVILSSLILNQQEVFAKEKYPTYNTVISNKKQFIWFRVSKAASRTISDILFKNEVVSTYNYDEPYNSSKYVDYFKFAFVRNPWARVVSCYENKIVEECYSPLKKCYGKDFEYFVRFIEKQDLTIADKHIRLQTESMPIQEMHFIGRLENFAEDFLYVLEMIGCKKTSYSHKNSSNHAHYSTYYTLETKAIIAEKYKKDIETFGYTFEKF